MKSSHDHGHDDAERWKHDGVRVIPGNQLDPNVPSTPGMDRKAAINFARAGAQKLWAGTVTIKPDAKTGAHHHGHLESIIYVVKGRARMRWGERLQFMAEANPGDFIFVPPYVPHQEINASRDEVLECVLVLTDAMPTQRVIAATAEGDEIWSSEYWARKGDIPLWMYRKRLGAPKPGEPSRPVLFFVHGSSVSSRAFDLKVPGHGEYSVMNEFARYGFDCWTMDHENYGKSGRTSGNSDIASGVEDLKAAVEVVAKETGRQKFHFLGESSGALPAGAYAMVAPERADRLGVR